MSISVLAISFDAYNAAQLAQFWAEALHRTVNDGATEDFASIAADTDSWHIAFGQPATVGLDHRDDDLVGIPQRRS